MRSTGTRPCCTTQGRSPTTSGRVGRDRIVVASTRKRLTDIGVEGPVEDVISVAGDDGYGNP